MLGRLREDQIEDVLRTATIGRIGCRDGESVYVVPISFVCDDGCVYGHSAEGRKLTLMRATPEVCFEVEDVRGAVRLALGHRLGHVRGVARRRRPDGARPVGRPIRADRDAARSRHPATESWSQHAHASGPVPHPTAVDHRTLRIDRLAARLGLHR